jgi:hypothetical protein
MTYRDDESVERQFDTGSPADGPDTVRILPDDTQPEADGRVDSNVVQRGTLYQRTDNPPATLPAESGKPASRSAIQAYEPASAPVRRGAHEAAVAPAASEWLGNPNPAPPAQVTHVHKGPTACAILAAVFGLVLLSCALLGFATFREGLSGLGKLSGVFPSFGSLVTTPTVTIDTSRPAVIDKVRALSKLETVHYQLEKVVTGKSSGPLPDIFTSDKILLVAHGEVVGGVDLSKLQPDDVTVMSDTVTIRMPEAEVLYSKLDNDKTYVYDRQTGIFTKPDPNLESQIRQAAEQEILKTAMEDGLLDKASTNAEDVIRTLLTGLGYTDVRFTESP